MIPSLVLASGEATGGAFSVVEHRLAPGGAGSPPPHRHKQLCDAFYILEGTLTLRIGDRLVSAGAGAFACFSPGVVHSFANHSNKEVRVLNINAPGGWDRVLRALATASLAETVTSQEVGEISSNFDMEVIAE
ncbi:cupin domain-containing protein [Ktedonosporobacter rubrisoli]|uniref:cupin domain-containing protein n=1 Tax=Ktedonosporobacter rubrisoli TaxID=2509675 RepID=UPI0013EEE7A5|nr:cupin domain-containing protein [Ktedonosporobacter rubrisoli]